LGPDRLAANQKSAGPELREVSRMRLMTAIAAVVGGVTLCGCHVVREVGYPADFVAENGPTHVWVTMADNSVHELWNPTLSGDTLQGFAAGNFFEAPVADVRIMRASFISPGRTAAALAGGLVLTAAAVAYGTHNATGTSAVCYAPGSDYIEICPGSAPNGAQPVVGDLIH